MFIFRYKYYKKNLISKYKSKASWYAIIESIKWPELIGFTLLVIVSIIIEDIKIRRKLKNRK